MYMRLRGKAALFVRVVPLAVVFAVVGYGASLILDDVEVAEANSARLPAMAVTIADVPAVLSREHVQRVVDAKDGAEMYMTRCMSCHQMNGRGVPGVFPPLTGAEWVTGDKGRLIRIVIGGLTGEVTVENEIYSGAMPPWGSFLDDKQMSDLLTYIRASWGNQASAVSPEDVSKVRAATKERREPWTAAELVKDENSGIPGEPRTESN